MKDLLSVSCNSVNYIVSLLKYSGLYGMKLNAVLERVDTGETRVVEITRKLNTLPEFDAYFIDDGDIRSAIMKELEKRDLIMYLNREKNLEEGRKARLYQMSYDLINSCEDGGSYE